MSELVEKVRAEMIRAMRDGHPQENYGYRQAHYAIKAVAEWLMSDKNYQTDNWAGKLLLAQLEAKP